MTANQNHREYSFDIAIFNKEKFNAGDFLEECQLHVPLRTLHDELEHYLQSLEHELVSLINRDYADFLQLSLELVGVDRTILSLKKSILQVRDRVQHVKNASEKLLKDIEEREEKMKSLKNEEENLKLSIRVFKSIEMMEDLLKIKEAEVQQSSIAIDKEEDIEDFEDNYNNFELEFAAYSPSEENDADGTEETCARLERVARCLEFIENDMILGAEVFQIQVQADRVQRIEEVLLERLEQELATEIVPDSFYSREHKINGKAVLYLIRAYEFMGKPEIVEDIFSRLVMHPFTDENFTRGRLDGGERGSCRGLPEICSTTISFIEKEFGEIIRLHGSGTGNSEVDILGNGIWKPIKEAFFNRLKTIFVPGNTEKFQANYICAMKFLESLEQFCGSNTERDNFRHNSSVLEFKSRWNVEAYAQLLYKECFTQFEDSLKDSGVLIETDSSNNKFSPGSLCILISQIAFNCMEKCWKKEVFLNVVAHKFTKLTLQILAGYIHNFQSPIEHLVKAKDTETQFSFEKLKELNEDVKRLPSSDHIYYICHDSQLLFAKIKEKLIPQMNLCLGELIDKPESITSELLKEPLNDLEMLSQQCLDIISVLIIDDCKKILPALRTIKNQYQMTNKPLPKIHSTFVPNILKPIQVYKTTWNHLQDDDSSKEWISSILASVTMYYHELVVDLLKSAKELEESLKSRKIRRTNVSSDSLTDVSDTDKMACQILLDVLEYGKMIQKLGIDLSKIKEYTNLKKEVQVAEKYLK